MDLNDSIPSVDDESDELTTAAQVVKKLEEVWGNELNAPELLNYEDELIDCLLDQIQHMEKSLEKIKKDDFRLVFHKMELDRIKFVLNSYLRARIYKIEKFAFYLLKHENEDLTLRDLMSEEERKFAKEYVSCMKNYLHDVALCHMPPNMQSLSLEDVCFKPRLNESVFIRVKKECRGVLLETASEYGEDEIIDLPQGTQHVLRYKPIAHLLKNGSVQLI